jgi:hypothetical protein
VSTERPTLADVIAAHRRFGMQCTCGWSAADLFRSFAESHDHHVADAAREHVLGLLGKEALVQSIGLYLGQVEGCTYACEGDRAAARAVLAQVAETVRDER